MLQLSQNVLNQWSSFPKIIYLLLFYCSIVLLSFLPPTNATHKRPKNQINNIIFLLNCSSTSSNISVCLFVRAIENLQKLLSLSLLSRIEEKKLPAMLNFKCAIRKLSYHLLRKSLRSTEWVASINLLFP